MAISKTQNERPAIIELIDTVNENSATIAQHGESIASLSGLIANETDARQRADEEIIRSLSATNAQVLALTGEVDDLTRDLAQEATTRANNDTALTQSINDVNARIDTVEGSVDALDLWRDGIDAFLSDLKIGETDSITVPANDSYSSSETFAVPFSSNDDCIVILQVITGELSTLFDVSLIDCTYSGFSYQITNHDADPQIVKLGYVAIRTNRE